MIVKSDLQKLCDAISQKYGNTCLNYGEAHQVITSDEGANYVSIEDSLPCSVNDNYDVVLFLFRTGSEPTAQIGVGNRTTLSRKVAMKLVCNAKGPEAEYNLAVIVNSIVGMTYDGTDNNAKSIAQVYFGTNEHQFETYFFTIDLTFVEKIICEKC